MINKEELFVLLNNKIKKSCNKKKEISENIETLNNKFNIPAGDLAQVFTLRKPIDSLDDFTLYAISSLRNYSIQTEKFFSKKEIEVYSKNKYKKEEIKFPLKFNMVQVSEDQWLGVISVKQLMELKESRLINYNINTQRTVKVFNNDGETTYKISLNRSAVDGIKDSFNKGTYIPNTITLNIPYDSDYSFNGNELIINSIDHFDILDGYHRYIAASYLMISNPDFDYTMELRITSFVEDKARQFIWQEDQKTKMKKIDSDSYNQNSYSNQVITLLNNDVLLRGTLGNGGVISSGIASAVLNYVYFNHHKKATRKDVIVLKQKLANRFEIILGEDVDIFNKKWDRAYTVCVFYCLLNDKIDDNILLREINRLYKISKDNNYFSKDTLISADIKKIEKEVS